MSFTRRTKSIKYGMEFTHGVRRALMSTLGLIYFLSLGFNLISVTTLFAVSTIIMTFFEFPTGAIADYDSRKKSIMISFLLMALAFFGLFYFRNFWLLAGSWILGDISWTFYSGAGSAWCIDALKYGKNKPKILDLISKSYFFEKGGWVIGGLIGLVVVAINFSFVWLCISILNVIMFFIVAAYMEEKNFKPEKIPHSYLVKSLIKSKETLNFIIHKKNKQLRVLMLGDFLGIFATSAFSIGMPLLFIKTLNLSTEHLSGVISIIAAFTVIIPLLSGKIAQKIGLKGPMVCFGFIISASMIVFALSNSIILAIVALTVLQLTVAALDVIEDSAFHHEFDSRIRASLGSVNSIVWAISFSIAVFLAGISISFFGIVPTIIVCGIISLLNGIVYLFGLKR